MKPQPLPHLCLVSLLLGAWSSCFALEDVAIRQLNRASQLVANKQWDRASTVFQEVLAGDPNNVHALVGQARLCMGQKRWKGAIELLERAQKQLPAQGRATEVTQWRAIGPFPNPGDGKGLDIAYPPEREIKLDATYDGKPAAISAAKGTLAALKQRCMSCHSMCRVTLPKTAPKVQMPLPKTPADIPRFAAGLKGTKPMMMALQTACAMGTQAAEADDVGGAAFAGAIMKAVQSEGNKMAAKNPRLLGAGRAFCTTAAALEAAAKVPAEIGWQEKSREDMLHLDRFLAIDNVVYYGLATLTSDKDQVVELRVGSDDGCKVWLNGEHVWTNRARRPVNPDQDRIIVRMRKGDNRLLMKIEQGGGQYGMGARVVHAMDVAGALRGAKQQYDKVKNKSLVRVSPRGLLPHSARQFWIYKGSRCVKKGLIGRTEILPPGKYTVRVGFPSGYVARDFLMGKGDEFTVPTGLFRFEEVTPADIASTVPQKLYHLPTGAYMFTGYQGTTARLYPGKYRVCYQDMNDEKPSAAFGSWHVIGVFPNPRLNKGFNVVYPPEKEPIPDLGRSYQSMGQTIRWQKVPGDELEVNIALPIPKWGVAYATASVESDAGRDIELVMTTRCGIKAWLNGQLVTTIPPARRSYYTRKATFAKLTKGRNVLFVKTLRTSGPWPLSAVAVHWKMYDVDVAAEDD